MSNGRIRISMDPSDKDGWATVQSIGGMAHWDRIRVTVDKTHIPMAELRMADEFEGKVSIRAEMGPYGVLWTDLKGHVRIVLPQPPAQIKRAPA